MLTHVGKNLVVNNQNLSTNETVPTFISINTLHTPPHSSSLFGHCHPEIMSIRNIVLAVLLLLSSHVQLYTASRILPEDLTGDLSLQSLQRGTIPPSKGSGCTNIPGGDGESCPLVNEMHYAGHGLPPDTAFPRLAVPFGVATSQR
ncbi:hypothetical protein SADUNF_Sadunf08G0133800 [Salix dunnii]|uniref:Uncharacterized protein n=1 Tax=Salix dunnii TaxID=1413687 RepID=A0A835MU86_9ROSI|nr:hypothetical protein SADUNF_Sadunf08G0133800 [Salix dunnii]